MLTCASSVASTDRPGLRNVELVQKIHAKLDQLLQKQISIGHPTEPALFDELKKKIPDLRTLNTLHSEKLLAIKLDAQCGSEQGEPVVSTSSSASTSSSSSSVDQHWSDFGSPRSVASSCDGDKMTPHSLDLGPYSPSEQMAQFHLSSSVQASSTNNNANQLSNNVHRRTPSSLSSSSTCSTSSVSKSGGLRFGSLSTTPSSTTTCPVSGSGFYSGSGAIQFGGVFSTSHGSSIVSNSSNNEEKNHLLLRRVDSPTDSGIESGKEGNSATSVCSSPRSDSEEQSARLQPVVVTTSRAVSPSSATSSNPTALEEMPMLKRALQAPPLLQTANNLLMDQAYRHHKKFRATKLQQQQMRREQQQTETIPTANICNNGSVVSSTISPSSPVPTALAAALQCPVDSMSSSDHHSLARTHSTLVRTLQQQPRFANEQQLKRTDLIHNIIMRSELNASPLMSSPNVESSVSLPMPIGLQSGLQQLLTSGNKFQPSFGACPASSNTISGAPSPLMRYQPQLPSPACSLVNAHSPPPFGSMLHQSMDMPLNLSKKPSAPITPPISPNAIKLEHGL